MEIFSNQQGLQFYGGNFLDGKLRGKHGTAYGHRTALCLETEGFPDATNQAAFPSAVLRPGKVYRHAMVYKFSAQ
jgi:aldose 1-epimerase